MQWSLLMNIICEGWASMSLPRTKKKKQTTTYPVLNNQNLLKGETKQWLRDRQEISCGLSKELCLKCPRRALTLGAWNRAGAFSTHFQLPAPRDCWARLPLDSHSHKRINTHTHGGLFPSLPAHSLSGWCCLPTHRNWEENRGKVASKIATSPQLCKLNPHATKRD